MSIPPLLRGGYGSSKEEGEESQRPKFFKERKAQTKPGISIGTAEKVAVLFKKKNSKGNRHFLEQQDGFVTILFK